MANPDLMTILRQELNRQVCVGVGVVVGAGVGVGTGVGVEKMDLSHDSMPELVLPANGKSGSDDDSNSRVEAVSTILFRVEKKYNQGMR